MGSNESQPSGHQGSPRGLFLKARLDASQDEEVWGEKRGVHQEGVFEPECGGWEGESRGTQRPGKWEEETRRGEDGATSEGLLTAAPLGVG